jgi:hypothetical protein
MMRDMMGGMRREWKSHVDPASRGPLLYAERLDVPNGLTLTNASEQELLLEVLALAERVRELEAQALGAAIRQRARIAALEAEARALRGACVRGE